MIPGTLAWMEGRVEDAERRERFCFISDSTRYPISFLLIIRCDGMGSDQMVVACRWDCLRTRLHLLKTERKKREWRFNDYDIPILLLHYTLRLYFIFDCEF